MKLEVDALDAAGRGVARNAGKVVFVEGATSVLRASSGRREPRCAYFGVCGGCATQHVDARTQVASKQRWLEDNLARIGKVQAGAVLPPIYGQEWGYRHRARLSVRYVEGKGGALVGFRERRSTHVADIRGCEVLPPRMSSLIVPLRELIGKLSIRDRVPQIEVAVGEAAAVLVFRHLLPLSGGDQALLREFADTTGVRVWLQPGGPDS